MCESKPKHFFLYIFKTNSLIRNIMTYGSEKQTTQTTLKEILIKTKIFYWLQTWHIVDFIRENSYLFQHL